VPGARSFTKALGLHGRTPFTSDVHAQHLRTIGAAQQLPGRPSLSEVSHGYDRALIGTFEHQSHRVQLSILRNAMRARSYEGDLLLRHASTPVDSAEALGLGGDSPFKAAVEHAGRRLQQAMEELPNPPRLLQVPGLAKLTPSQRSDVLSEQGRRLSALSRSTGLSGDDLRYALPPGDADQLKLFARLARQQQQQISREVGNTPRYRSYPAKPRGLVGGAAHVAGVSLPMALVGHDFSVPLAQIGATGRAVAHLGGPVVSDATHLVPDSALSLYALGDAGVQAAHGNLGPTKRIGQGLASGVIGHLARGDVRGAAAYAQRHPLYALMEISGAEGAVGRSAGAVMRSGALGPAVRELAATRRAPVLDAYGRTIAHRSYSKDVIRKSAQVAYDRTRFRDGVPKSSGAQGRYARDRVDEFAGMQENLRRISRQEATLRMGEAMPTRTRIAPIPGAEGFLGGARNTARKVPGALDRLAPTRMRPERNIMQAVVEGRVNPRELETSLRAERNRLTQAYVAHRDRMTAAQRMANQRQIRDIDRVLANPKALANVAGIERAAGRFKAAADTTEGHAIQLGLLDRDQALAAKVRPYAVARMGAHWSGEGLVGPDGSPLPTSAVLEHMHEHGVPMPAFVSHQMSTAGARAFLVNWFDRRRTLDARQRTGTATELGAHASDFPSMAQHYIHTQGTVDAVGGFDRFVHSFGIKHPSGRMFTWAEAQRLAADPTPIGGLDSHGNPIPGRAPLVPVRVMPARYSPATREAIAGMQDATAMPSSEGLVEERIRQAQLPPDNPVDARAQNVVLVPANEMRRFAEHQQRYSNTGSKLMQVGTNLFRSTTLPFSTKWVAGNTVEASLRLALVGATPRDAKIGWRLVRALERHDAAAAKEFRARTLGGLMYGGSQKLAIHRDAESFKGSRLEKPAMAAGALRRTQPVKVTGDAIMGLGHAVFALNRAIEHGAEYAAIGKFARTQIHEVTGSWLTSIKAAQPALDDLAKGLVETPAQVRYARYIDETLGKYSRFGPTERRLFQTIAPFAPWYLNSLRFVFWTLPAKHPVKQAVIASVANTFQRDWEAQHRNLPPGSLRHGLVRHDGGVVDITRFLPFGAFTSLDNASQLALPEFSGTEAALAGKSWTGADLRTSHGKATGADRALIAINSLAESMVPGMAIGRRLREDGYAAFDNSTILTPKTKPGTKHGSAIDRVFNPLRPTYLRGASGSTGPPVPGLGHGPALGKGPALGRGPRLGRPPALGR
jgi:hypothetical protein